MRGYRVTLEVVWRPDARDDLYEIYDWVAGRADPDTAYGYAARIEAKAQRIGRYPDGGTPRAYLGAKVRTITFERRIIIVYHVDTDAVTILRLFHSARDLRSTPR